MKPEVIFGMHAGKVWLALKSKGPLSADALSKTTKLKLNEVFAALGWLGREGKIDIIAEKQMTLYKLL